MGVADRSILARIRRRAVFAAAVTVAVLSVSGCSGGVGAPELSSSWSPSSTSSTDPGAASQALRVVPHIWRVREAAGESADTWMILGTDVDLIRPRGDVFLSWSTQGDALLTHVDGWSMSLGTTVPTVPWLTRTTRFTADGDDWILSDAGGRRTARLVVDGTPPPSTQSLHEVPTVDGLIRTLHSDAVPGADVIAIDPADVIGTWGLPGVATSDASVRLRADGTWRARTSCAVLGTSDGGGGAYRALPTGMLLVTESGIAGTGCSAPEHAPPSDATAVTAFSSAGSITLDGAHLTVFDRTGTRLGTLTRTG